MPESAPAAPAATSSPAPAVQPTTQPGSAPGSAAPDAATQTQATKSEAKTEPKPEPRKLKLKVDDREEELPEDEVVRLAQKGKAANKRFEEAAKLAKDAKRIIDEARNPESRKAALVQLLGSEDAVREFAEGLILEQLKQESMSAEERAAAEEKAELERYRKAEKERKEREEQEAQTAAQARVEAQLEKTILSVAKAAGLPEAPWAYEVVVDVLRPIVEHGIDLTQEQLVAEVKEAMTERAKQRDTLILEGLEGEALIKYLGPAMLKKILAATVATHKPAAPAPPPVVEEKPDFSNMTTAEWQEYRRQKRAKG